MDTPVRRSNRMDTPNRYRTIWPSDVHLGACTALVEHLDGHLEIVRWVTIDHDTRLPGRTALSGDDLSEQPPVAARPGTALHHPA